MGLGGVFTPRSSFAGLGKILGSSIPIPGVGEDVTVIFLEVGFFRYCGGASIRELIGLNISTLSCRSYDPNGFTRLDLPLITPILRKDTDSLCLLWRSEVDRGNGSHISYDYARSKISECDLLLDLSGGSASYVKGRSSSIGL